MKPMCRHCYQHRVNRRRGLCWLCYEDIDIREQYAPQASRDVTARMSMAELDAFVESNRPTMPGYQDKE